MSTFIVQHHVKCNQFEFRDQFKIHSTNNLLEKFDDIDLKNKAIFITLGYKGMVVFKSDEKICFNIDGIRVEEEIDTCGAGDTATAGIVIGLCLGLNIEQSAILGNIAASITIKKLNTTGEATLSECLEKYKQAMGG